MVVFPQGLKLSRERLELSPRDAHFFPTENPQLATKEIRLFHKFTDPYYDYWS